MASRAFVSITTADALAPNWRQDISCGNADLLSVEYVRTKLYSSLHIQINLTMKKQLEVMTIFLKLETYRASMG